MSQYDNKIRTERSRIDKIEKVKNNFFRGGAPPFGYRIYNVQGGVKLVIDEYESNYVKMVYEMYLSGIISPRVNDSCESLIDSSRIT